MTFQETSPVRQSPKALSTSLFLKYAAIIACLIVIVFIMLTLLFIKGQKEVIYRTQVGAGEMLLSQLANRASLPLLENDLLNLHGMIKEMKGAKGIPYVAIVDSKKIIRAHTDSDKIGIPWVDTPSGAASSGEQLLHLSRPMTFMNQNTGWVALGLSLDVINDQIKEENLSLIKSLSLFGFFALLIGAGTAFLFARWANLEIPSHPVADSQGKTDPLPPIDSSVTRTQATILSAGIKDFKAYAKSRNPQQVLKDLNDFFSIATDGILEHGGYVDTISGDAVIGVFRSSPFQKNHTVRAIRCAISIKKTLEQGSQKGNPLLIRAGFGISSGVLLSGPILSQEGKEATLIGESFKEASSLNEMAGPGEIVFSKDVYQSIEKLVSAQPLPPRETTQRTESWENFRLLHIAERKDEG